MSNTSNHGGARPGAGRKPNSTNSLNAAERLYYGRKQVTETLPQLFEALQSLAQGATTTHERWGAAGTLTTGSGANKEPLFSHLPADELVLVARHLHAQTRLQSPPLHHKTLPRQSPPRSRATPSDRRATARRRGGGRTANGRRPNTNTNAKTQPNSSCSPPFQGGVPRSGGVVQPENSDSPLLEKDNSASPRLCGSSPAPQPPQKRPESPSHYRTQEKIDAENAISPPPHLDDDLLYTISRIW